MIQTDDFFTVTANEWNGAVHVGYGVLSLVTYVILLDLAVKFKGLSCHVITNGVTEISIAEGSEYTISQDTTNTYPYYISLMYN